eukprot:g4261.t1
MSKAETGGEEPSKNGAEKSSTSASKVSEVEKILKQAENRAKVETELNNKARANLFLNISVIIQWTNLLVMPAIYVHLAARFKFTTVQLGLLQTMRTFSMFASLPIYGILAAYFPRGKVLGLSCLACAGVTILHFVCRDFASFMVFTCLAGATLGAIHPVGRSLVAVYYKLEDRGKYYGFFELAAGIGGVTGAVIGTVLGNINSYKTDSDAIPQSCFDIIKANAGVNNASFLANQTISNASLIGKELDLKYSIEGWQIVFIVIGIMTIPGAVGMLYYVQDPMNEPTLKDKLGDHDLRLVFPGLATDSGNEVNLSLKVRIVLIV